MDRELRESRQVVEQNVEKDLEHYMMIVESIPSTHPNLQDFEEEAIHEVLGALRSRKTKVLMTKIHIDEEDILEKLKKQMDFAKLGIIVPNELLELIPNVIRCKDCKWFGHPGCAIEIVDDSDRPKENDFCSFAERKEN